MQPPQKRGLCRCSRARTRSWSYTGRTPAQHGCGAHWKRREARKERTAAGRQSHQGRTPAAGGGGKERPLPVPEGARPCRHPGVRPPGFRTGTHKFPLLQAARSAVIPRGNPRTGIRPPLALRAAPSPVLLRTPLLWEARKDAVPCFRLWALEGLLAAGLRVSGQRGRSPGIWGDSVSLLCH